MTPKMIMMQDSRHAIRSSTVCREAGDLETAHMWVDLAKWIFSQIMAMSRTEVPE